MTYEANRKIAQNTPFLREMYKKCAKSYPENMHVFLIADTK